MKISDRGIIISKRLLEENSGIVTIFSEENGLYSGVASKLLSKAGIDIHQIGNLVDFNWNARLASHIGRMRCELVTSYVSKLMYDKQKLYALNSILDIIAISLRPHEKYPHLYIHIIHYIENLLINNFSYLDYMQLELDILSEIGYGLDIAKCCSTGSPENLKYVSPKSGKAVSHEAGKPYESKLLPLPEFLTSKIEPYESEDIIEALELTGYFFRRYVFKDGRDPHYREMLISLPA